MQDTGRHQSKPIWIDNRRWDPVTSINSSISGIGTRIAKATANMVIKLYAEYKRGLPRSSSPTLLQTTTPLEPTSSSTDYQSQVSREGLKPGSKRSSDLMNGLRTTGAMAGASAKGFGNFVMRFFKRSLIDIPLAATEGLHAVPKLYGDEVKDHGKVTGMKSGAVVVGKPS